MKVTIEFEVLKKICPVYDECEDGDPGDCWHDAVDNDAYCSPQTCPLLESEVKDETID